MSRTGELYSLATKQDVEDLRTYVLMRDQEILQSIQAKKRSGRAHSYMSFMSRKEERREEPQPVPEPEVIVLDPPSKVESTGR